MSDTTHAQPSSPRRLQRDEILTRVDLATVAERFLGAPSRRRGEPVWPCPHPEHPHNTAEDARPSLRITGSRDGVQRWRCGTCDGFGTAVDIVMHSQGRSFREALRLLDDLPDQPPAPPVLPVRPLGVAPATDRSLWQRRDALLGGVDLTDLAVRFLGPGKGRGRSRSWPCPAPSHGPQTGRTPPLTVFRGRDGTQRWKCHSCGAGGTAVDLVMVTQQRTPAEALRYLGEIAGDRPAPLPAARPRPLVRDARPHPAVMFYVDRCQQWLWSDLGLPGRNLLHRRGLSDEVLRANRVGYDPGPGHLPRRSGLPRGGPAIVLPVLDDQAESRYVQARYLTPVGDRRYDNPTEQLVGPSPRVGFPRPISVDVDPGKALICEGVFDALSATQAGYTTAAYLSASAPDEQTARTLLDRFGDRHLLLLFDDNDAGRAGAERLRGLLTEYGAGDRVSSVVPQHGDLNQWLQNAGEKFPAELRTAIDVATRNVYRVAVLQQSFVEAHPAGGESPAARYQHVHTFELPVEPVRHNVAHGPFNGEPRDPAVEAAELVCDITDRDPENLLPPFDDLARGWHQGDHGRVHPGDVLIVSAPNGTTTTLECTRWGWDRLDVPPAVPTADLPAAAPSIGANLRLTL